MIGNIEQKFPGEFSCFLFKLLPYVFSYGKTSTMSASRKHKMVNTDRKGARKGAK